MSTEARKGGPSVGVGTGTGLRRLALLAAPAVVAPVVAGVGIASSVAPPPVVPAALSSGPTHSDLDVNLRRGVVAIARPLCLEWSSGMGIGDRCQC